LKVNAIEAMTLQEFKSSLINAEPPTKTNLLLKALWFDGKGDWEAAHNIAQDINNYDGSSIHAYLHRKEGDLGNASYWYYKAGKSMPEISLEKEWEELVEEFMKK
jgi:hypothetical protein